MSKWQSFGDLENIKGTNNTNNIGDILPQFADMLAFFQMYPDVFIDYLLPDDSKFELYPFQRIYLRIMSREKKVFITATRGTSKSFLNILSMYLKCMFFPGIKLSLIAPFKEQAASIAKANIDEIWKFIPILEKEIAPKGKTFAKDFTRLKFLNGSILDIVVASQGSRGLRRHGLSFEEIVQMEKHREIIGEVLLPLLANNRIGADGKVSKHEIHKQLMYVTTASSKQSYAWEQLHSVMLEMARGQSAFVIGNDYELPVLFEQLDREYIEEVRKDPSMSPLQFAREYMSVWTGSSENSLVQLKDLEKCRVLTVAEFKQTKKTKNEAKNTKGEIKYIISVDVARSERKGSATTAIAVIKTISRGNGTYWKQLVNVHTYKGSMHYENQSIYIKELAEKFDASMVVVDGNSLGTGLLDQLVLEDRYPSYSVVNDETYNKYKMPNSIPLLFNMQSNRKGTMASDIHNNFMNVISNHDLKLLVSDSQIKEKSKEDDYGKLAKLLLPYVETGLFVDEVMNLTYETSANRTTTVKQVSKSMDKDRYSAISYGLYYIHLEEQKNQQRKREVFDASGFFAVKKAKNKIWD